MKTFKLLNALNNSARFHMAIINSSTSCYDMIVPRFSWYWMGGIENSNFNHPASLIFILIPCFNGPIETKLGPMQRKANNFDLKVCTVIFVFDFLLIQSYIGEATHVFSGTLCSCYFCILFPFNPKLYWRDYACVLWYTCI